MKIANIQFNDANNYGSTSGAWVVVLPSDTTPKAITDENGDPTGWTIRWASTDLAPGAGGGEGYNGVGVGAAAWANEANVLRRAVFFNSFSGQPYCELIIEGPDTLTIKAAGSYQGSTSHQDTEIWVNSETPQIMLTYDVANARGNNSDAVTFADVVKNGNNQFAVRFRNNSGDRGYISGLQLVAPVTDTTPPSYEVAPAVTETRENGHTISGTADEDSVFYGVRLPAGATVPTSQQVIDGQDASGSPALEADSVVASAGISADLDFVTASASTGYRYAIVAVDDEPTPNVQATPTVIDDTTAAAVVEGISAQTIRDKAGDLTPNATNLKIAVRASSDPESVVHFSTTTGSLNGSSQTAAINLESAGVTVGDTVHFSYFNPALNEGLNVDLTVEDIA